MQTNLNRFLSLSQGQTSDGSSSDYEAVADLVGKGKHYWTGLKTVHHLSNPGRSNYDILVDILSMQQTPEYAEANDEASTEYLFDPDKYGLKDETLVTNNYALPNDELREYGILATKLRQQFEQRSNELREQSSTRLQENESASLDQPPK